MDRIADRYLRFAKVEAAGRSPLYEQWALHVANSLDALAFLQGLPVDKQQPNLLFAAFRHIVGVPTSPAEFDAGLAQHDAAIRALMLTRSTQTNEPGRCAVLLPALASVRGKIALIEVGASAGLCLLMDKYGYDWGDNAWLRVETIWVIRYSPVRSPARALSPTPILKLCGGLD